MVPTQPRTNYRLVKVLAGIGAVCFLYSLFIIYLYHASVTSKTPEERAKAERVRVEEVAAENPQVAMMLRSLSWEKGGFGSVLLADMTVVNGNTFAVKDVEISCVVHGPSGTALGTTKHTIYDVVPAHGEKRFEKVNMGFINAQTNRASCAVNGAVGLLSAGL